MKLIAQEDIVGGRESNAIVESALRLAHDRGELEATALGRDIRGWEVRAARPLLAF